MLYDLNIVWTPQTTQADLERTLRFSQSLGYDVVALNHIFGPPVAANAANSIPQIGPVHPSFPQQTTNTNTTNNRPSAGAGAVDTPKPLPITLRRATILVSDPTTNHRLAHLAATYDLLACRPTTEKAFVAACTSWAEVALISLDLTQHTPFRLKPKPCMAAVARGALFEVCYGQLLGGAADPPQPRARAAFVANVLELARATRGRGIILSSEARAAVQMRAPADVVNLFAVWGLGPERGLEGLGANPRAVVVNEGLRRRGFRGVVDIVGAEGRVVVPGRFGEQGERGEDGGGGGEAGKGGGKKQKVGGKQQQQQQTQGGGNGKRKHDGTGGSDHSAGGDQTAAPAVSKRQAKKMKLAEREKEKKTTTPTTETAAVT